MKIIEHPRTTKPEKMELKYSPMVVWIDAHTELHIEKGDTIETIAGVLKGSWGYDYEDCAKVAAFWFAVGERRSKKEGLGSWTKEELRQDPNRRYLETPKTKSKSKG